MRGLFGLLFNWSILSPHKLRSNAWNVHGKYFSDFEQEFVKETIQFQKFVNGKSMSSPHQYCQYIKEQNLDTVFPNETISMKIYLTFPVTSARRKQSF